MRKNLSAIRETLDTIFGGADEIIGNHAPYEMDAERRFVKEARKAIEKALMQLHKPVRDTLNRDLKRMAQVRDAEIQYEEAIWNETYRP